MKSTIKQLNREINKLRISLKDNLSLSALFLGLILINIFTGLGGNRISVMTIHVITISLLIGNLYRAYQALKSIKIIEHRILKLKKSQDD